MPRSGRLIRARWEATAGAFAGCYQHRAAGNEFRLLPEATGQEDGRFSLTRNPPHPLSSGQAKAQVVVPVTRLVPVAVRRPGVAGVVVPRAAAVHPVRGLWPSTERDSSCSLVKTVYTGTASACAASLRTCRRREDGKILGAQDLPIVDLSRPPPFLTPGGPGFTAALFQEVNTEAPE